MTMLRSQTHRWLDSMSIEEQIGQMSQIDINMLLSHDENGTRIDEAAVEHFIGDLAIGSVLNCPSAAFWTAQEYRKAVILIQETARKHQRPPVIWGLDSVHGANYVRGAIVTPQPLNLAATFNISVPYQAGKMASKDTRAAGINWLFSPLVGIAVNPYWSRVYETFGEDPYLVGQFASKMVQGIQAKDDDGSIPSRAAASAKHFVGYSDPRNGHDRSPSQIPTRQLYQYFVPPWRKVAHETLTVMESYTETDGIPNVANRKALDYLLRQRLGFTGVVVTDYEEMRNLYQWHHVAYSYYDAIQQSIREGSVDMSMIPWDADGFRQAILDGIDSHALSPERIQESAERVLKLKELLNMNKEVVTEDDPNIASVGSKSDQAMALDMTHQSIVLAKNDGGMLPLSLDGKATLKVLVTGPTATSLRYQSGGWTIAWQGASDDTPFTYGSSVLDAFSADANYDVSYRCGVDILGQECEDDGPTPNPTTLEQVKEWVGLGPNTSIARAAIAASTSDVVVVCLGEENYTEKPGDIRDLDLPQGQYQLVRAIRGQAPKVKILLVYFGGRPRLLRDAPDLVDSVLVGFLPGPLAGQAVADIASGRVNPSARMPITYPKYPDGAGGPYFHSISDKCTRGDGPMPHYEYVPCEVQWPFGHGLSYSNFQYSVVSASGGIMQDLEVTVAVTNIGNVDGSDAVLIFTFDEFRSSTPEYKRLRAFDKVHLKAGATTTLSFTVSLDDLKFVGPHDDHHYILDPSIVRWVGVGASTDCRNEESSTDPKCFKLQPSDSSSPGDSVYIGACHEACKVWQQSGCLSVVQMTSDSCTKTCESIAQYPTVSEAGNNDGWGWTYVDCLESVVWGNRQLVEKKDKSFCWEMTSMCRDVFATGQMDEFGIGGSKPATMMTTNPVMNMVALLTGLAATVFMVYLMNGGSLPGRKRRTSEIQFTPVHGEDLGEPEME